MAIFPRRYSYKKYRWLIPAFCFDLLIAPLVFLFRKKNLSLSSVSRLLLMPRGGIGDAVLLEPLIRTLREKYPQIVIDVAPSTRGGEIFGLMPIDVIVEIEELKKIYDAAFDTQGNPFLILKMIRLGISLRFGYGNGGGVVLLSRSADSKEEISKHLQHLRIFDLPESVPKLDRNHPALQKGHQLAIEAAGGRTIVAIHPGGSEQKKLAPISLWTEQINKIPENYAIILLGTAEDAHLLDALPAPLRARLIDLSGRSLYDEIGMLTAAESFIGIDSGFAHLARAFDIKTTCLFSLCHKPSIWAPAGANIITFGP